MYSKVITIGYHKERVIYDKELKFCPYGSCGIVNHPNGVYLYSYETRVCALDNDGYISCTGTYSATTRKHIGAFLKEYAPMLNYYDVKSIAGVPIKMHIRTKEKMPIN